MIILVPTVAHKTRQITCIIHQNIFVYTVETTVWLWKCTWKEKTDQCTPAKATIWCQQDPIDFHSQCKQSAVHASIHSCICRLLVIQAEPMVVCMHLDTVHRIPANINTTHIYFRVYWCVRACHNVKVNGKERGRKNVNIFSGVCVCVCACTCTYVLCVHMILCACMQTCLFNNAHTLE